jgi:hypothetical protein
MSLKKTCAAAASAGLAAGLLALSAAGPAAAATPAAGRITPAATEVFDGTGPSLAIAVLSAEVQAMDAGFTKSQCTVTSTTPINSEDWFATVSCTN